MDKPTLEERFFAKVNKTETCWLWTASKHPKGYGHFGGPQLRAHRMSWVIHHGSIPEGLQVLHKCDNPSCVNPKHLFLGTNLDNMRDCAKKGRRINRGTKNPRAKITEDDVRSIRADERRQVDIAKQYGLAQTTVSDIKLKNLWPHIK